MEKEPKKRVDIHRHTPDALCCTPETNTILEIHYAPIIFKIKKNNPQTQG